MAISKKTTSKPGRLSKAFFLVIAILLLLLMLVFLELNKNTIPGWILTAALGIGFIMLGIKKPRMHLILKVLAWPAWIVLFVLVVFLTWPPVKPVPAVSTANPEKTAVISIGQGDLTGVKTEDGEVDVFAGIPYAKAPVGELRWKEPQDPEKWDGILEADTFAPMSMQPRNLPFVDSLTRIIGFHDFKISLDDNCIRPMSEDSLYLNIWRPADTPAGAKLPVLVYIHGGTLMTGQTWYADYNGESLAQKGAIVVNMAYRLGVFGYYADEKLQAESPNGTTGNYGLLDQIKSLEWVQQNIAAFGGDPDNVTIAGESAGAASVNALCVSPLAKGLFRRAIAESSTVTQIEPPHSYLPLGDSLKLVQIMLDKYGTDDPAALRALPAEEIVEVSNDVHYMTNDGYALIESPYESYKKGIHNEEAMLHGYNSEESSAFLVLNDASLKDYKERIETFFGEYTDDVLALYPASTDQDAAKNWQLIYGALFFDYSHYCQNRLSVENAIPTYEYYFDKANGYLGPWHSGELVYCYGNNPDDSALFTDRDRELSEQMQDYWFNFALTGDPNKGTPETEMNLPSWEPNADSSSSMEFGEETRMITEEKHKLFAIMDEMYGWK